MTRVLLGLGSNIEPERHLLAAAQEIRQRFPSVRFSAAYRSAAVGMEGDDFLNACCLIVCGESLSELERWLKGLEDKHGRDRSEGSWKPRTLDLDILMADDQVLDDDLFRYAHVYVPARELIAIDLPEERGDLRQVGLEL
jgi:2-amino-4-hydroxy-6-hydroxymethyldihydropteridine diphosphokinase